MIATATPVSAAQIARRADPALAGAAKSLPVGCEECATRSVRNASSMSRPFTTWPPMLTTSSAMRERPGVPLAPPHAPCEEQQTDAGQGDERGGGFGHPDRRVPLEAFEPARDGQRHGRREVQHAGPGDRGRRDPTRPPPERQRIPGRRPGDGARMLARPRQVAMQAEPDRAPRCARATVDAGGHARRARDVREDPRPLRARPTSTADARRTPAESRRVPRTQSTTRPALPQFA